MGLTGLAVMAAAVTATISSVNANSTEFDLLSQNIEALTNDEQGGGLAGVACSILGCCGGDYKCFTGSVTYNGISIEGTFYIR